MKIVNIKIRTNREFINEENRIEQEQNKFKRMMQDKKQGIADIFHFF